VEVTCNLFTLWSLEQMWHIEPTDAPMLQRHLTETAPAYLLGAQRPEQRAVAWETWREEPFIALVTYVWLVRDFGWGPLMEVLAGYERHGVAEADWPEQRKRDEWATRYSAVVAHDLGPYFRAWALPLSEKALAAMRGLPLYWPPSMPVECPRQDC
jgi:hypothetical protein